MESGYRVPALALFDAPLFSPGGGGGLVVRFEEEIKRSRFITTLAHADSRERALAFVECVRREFPDARHHCWAYAVGRPGDTARVGQSDDGEPQKTAGMPILEVLRHSGLEDVIIVVVRYFGGTLLGTGGLVRAYTGAAQAAVAAADILSYSLCVDISIQADYSLYDRLANLFSTCGAKILQTEFTDKVFIKGRMISGTQQKLVDEIKLLTKGREPDISREIYDIF